MRSPGFKVMTFRNDDLIEYQAESLITHGSEHDLGVKHWTQVQTIYKIQPTTHITKWKRIGCSVARLNTFCAHTKFVSRFVSSSLNKKGSKDVEYSAITKRAVLNKSCSVDGHISLTRILTHYSHRRDKFQTIITHWEQTHRIS